MGRRQLYSVTVYLDRREYLRLKECAKSANLSLSKAAREYIVNGLPARAE